LAWGGGVASRERIEKAASRIMEGGGLVADQ